MLVYVAGSMLWMNNWQVQSFRAHDSHRTAVKTSELARRFAIFTNKIICSTLTLYVANLGIDVIIIGVAQQRKPKFSLPCKIFTELHNSPSKNIPFFQNADSRFLMNTVIVQVALIGINVIQASSKFSSCEIFKFFKAFLTSRCWAHEP